MFWIEIASPVLDEICSEWIDMLEEARERQMPQRGVVAWTRTRRPSWGTNAQRTLHRSAWRSGPVHQYAKRPKPSGTEHALFIGVTIKEFPSEGS